MGSPMLLVALALRLASGTGTCNDQLTELDILTVYHSQENSAKGKTEQVQFYDQGQVQAFVSSICDYQIIVPSGTKLISIYAELGQIDPGKSIKFTLLGNQGTGDDLPLSFGKRLPIDIRNITESKATLRFQVLHTNGGIAQSSVYTITVNMQEFHIQLDDVKVAGDSDVFPLAPRFDRAHLASYYEIQVPNKTNELQITASSCLSFPDINCYYMYFTLRTLTTNNTLTSQNKKPFRVKITQREHMFGMAIYILSTVDSWNISHKPVEDVVLTVNLTTRVITTAPTTAPTAPTAAPTNAPPLIFPTPSPQQQKEATLYKWFPKVLISLSSLVLFLVFAIIRERWKVQAQQQRVIGLENQKRDPDPLDDLLKDIEGSEWSLPFDFIKIAAKIGSGASGQVYMAKMGPHTVAAKQLFSHMVVSEYQEIQHEARLLSRLHHPALVRFYGITRNKVMVPADPGGSGSGGTPTDGVEMVVDRDELYLIMEYCPRSLAQLLVMTKEFQITDSKFVGYAQQLAQGVAFLHSRGVIHRDLKPENGE
jgi:hypothetical protein